MHATLLSLTSNREMSTTFKAEDCILIGSLYNIMKDVDSQLPLNPHKFGSCSFNLMQKSHSIKIVPCHACICM